MLSVLKPSLEEWLASRDLEMVEMPKDDGEGHITYAVVIKPGTPTAQRLIEAKRADL
jgi:hypothetical protein